MTEPYYLINAAGEWEAEVEWDGRRPWHIPEGWTRRRKAEYDGVAKAPPPPAKAVPVEACQMRLWLLKAGLLARVESALQTMPGEAGEAARIEWEYRTHYRPESPLVAALGSLLGLGPTQIAEAFAEASAL